MDSANSTNNQATIGGTTATVLPGTVPEVSRQPWVCPKCGAACAPWVDQCPCAASPWRIVTVPVTQPQPWYPYYPQPMYPDPRWGYPVVTCQAHA